MLKATINGKYRKANGQLVYTYTVTGTAKEIAEYNAAQAEQTGTTVDQLKKSASGQPLYWFVSNPLQGRFAQKTFNLAISYGGKIVIDDTAESVAKDERMAVKMEDHQALILAEISLGVRKVLAPTTAAAVTKTETVIEDKKDDVVDDLDKATEELQNTGAEEPALEGAEDLNG